MNTLRQAARARLRARSSASHAIHAPPARSTRRRLTERGVILESGFRTLVVAGTYGEVDRLTRTSGGVTARGRPAARGAPRSWADTHHVGSLDEVIALTRHA